MLHIEFEYRDAWSGEKWRKQECIMSSVDKCIELYGLGIDCEYRILKIENLDEKKARE